MTSTDRPRIDIEYCTQCQWLLRAAWLGQELLSTFGADISEVALRPGTGGVFVVSVDGEPVWDRAERGFPEAAELKRVLRDRVWPERELGHTDGAGRD